MQEFRHIMFFEEGHKYLNINTKQPYKSVTQTIDIVKPEVNWDFWAVYKQLQEEGPVKAWYAKEMIHFNGGWHHYTKYLDKGKIKKGQWKEKADKGKEKGTFIHFYLENLFNNKVIAVPKKYKNMIGGAKKFYKDHRHLEPVYAEQVVGDDEYFIAGQIDRPFRLTTNKLAIYDFKTDIEIEFDNKYTTLKPPFDNMPDCNFSKYTIQVNMYRWIVERNTGWTVEYMKIVHLKDDSYDLYDVPRINVEPLADEVRRTHK